MRWTAPLRPPPLHTFLSLSIRYDTAQWLRWETMEVKRRDKNMVGKDASMSTGTDWEVRSATEPLAGCTGRKMVGSSH